MVWIRLTPSLLKISLFIFFIFSFFIDSTYPQTQWINLWIGCQQLPVSPVSINIYINGYFLITINNDKNQSVTDYTVLNQRLMAILPKSGLVKNDLWKKPVARPQKIAQKVKVKRRVCSR